MGRERRCDCFVGGLEMSDRREQLLFVVNKMAVDLITTNYSSFTVGAIETRMKRIADDLVAAVDEVK